MRTQLRIGEAATLLGVSTKTIRHYQRLGLLAEPECTRTEPSICLRTPQVLRGTFGPTPPVTTVHLAVDELERLARALDARAAHYADAPRSGGAPVAREPAGSGSDDAPRGLRTTAATT